MINKKNERGITLLTLVLTIVILLIVTTALMMNSHTSVNLSNITRLQNDIDALTDRVAVYYVKNGKLPIYREDSEYYKYKKDELKFNDIASQDGSVYYTIDLSKLDNLSLNYGERYNSSEATDKYIINEKTHAIYYLKGIFYDGIEYHTITSSTILTK